MTILHFIVRPLDGARSGTLARCRNKDGGRRARRRYGRARVCVCTCTAFHVWPLRARTQARERGAGGRARAAGGDIHEVVSAYAQTRCAFVACVVGILCAILRIPIRVYSLNSLLNWHFIKIRPFTTPSKLEIGK